VVGWGGGFGFVFRMDGLCCCLVGTRRGWFGLDWAWYIIVCGICEYFHTQGYENIVFMCCCCVMDGGLDT
jgi:hypothetical protein